MNQDSISDMEPKTKSRNSGTDDRDACKMTFNGKTLFEYLISIDYDIYQQDTRCD